MPHENIAELFIRLLAETIETDRVSRERKFSTQAKAYSKRFRRRLHSAHEYECRAMDPMDCVQLMSDAPRERLIG